MQDLIDDLRNVVVDRDGCLVFPEWRVAQESLIDGGEEERRVGKELLTILAREDRGGAGERDDQVGLGTGGVRGLRGSRRLLLGAPIAPVGLTTD